MSYVSAIDWFFPLQLFAGKRAAESSAAPKKEKRAKGSDDEDDEAKGSDEEVEIVADDLEGIDASNILPTRGRRRAAIASGLARPTSAPAKPAAKPPSSSSGSKAQASSNSSSTGKKRFIPDSDEEADF